MHVSPFMPMNQSYEWRATEPGDRLNVSIRNRQEGRIVFEAGLALRRKEMTRRTMREILFRYPPMTVSTIARIYWNAARLKTKGAPYFQRPTSEPPEPVPPGTPGGTGARPRSKADCEPKDSG